MEEVSLGGFKFYCYGSLVMRLFLEVLHAEKLLLFHELSSYKEVAIRRGFAVQ